MPVLMGAITVQVFLDEEKVERPVSLTLASQDMVRLQVVRILEARQNDAKQSERAEDVANTSAAGAEITLTKRPTIYDQILDSNLPAYEKQLDRLVEQGQEIMAGGSETTARALYVTTFFLLKNPEMIRQLRAELIGIMPHPSSEPAWAELERLPFFTAVIKEGIRHAGSFLSRQGRVSKTPIQYKEWTIPAGTPVSLTANDVLTDSRIFPNPNAFDPMRWLVHEEIDGVSTLVPNPEIEKYNVLFSKGPRSCIGMWLAYAEMYLGLARIFRRFNMELCDTEVEDVATARDFMAGYPKAESRGVRVKITHVVSL